MVATLDGSKLWAKKGGESDQNGSYRTPNNFDSTYWIIAEIGSQGQRLSQHTRC